MCGIFGLTVEKEADKKELHNAFDALVRLSESRGKEAAGLALFGDTSLTVLKDNVRGTQFIKREKYRELIETNFKAVIGHTRLVTNGSMEEHTNNQPVIRDNLVGIHNGIIVNDTELFKEFNLKRTTEVDTEVLLALIEQFGFNEVGIKKAFAEIEGEASVAIFSAKDGKLVLATNNGSLYAAKYKYGQIFASERFILEHLPSTLEVENIEKLEPGAVRIFDLGQKATVQDLGPSREHLYTPPAPHDQSLVKKYQTFFDTCAVEVAKLRRCTKCILPETMPFITFDEKGVCNYCANYEPKKLKDISELKKLVSTLDKAEDPNCLFPLSGGRDSSYGLHYVKKVLGLNPITYSYDWGMLTDLGRRNQARMSGALGVEHLWLSADIIKKRQNIRKNVLAWLKKPDLGTVPLFMAGDKQYFYYINKLRKQLGTSTVFYCENFLEKTDFKFGFCGIAPKFGLKHVYNLGIVRKLRLALYYLKQFLTNPAYFNSSLLDTLGAYLSTYFIPHDYVFLYDYLRWDEQEINKLLIEDYKWEISPDTPTTWRIGDGTAAFYNYIYYVVAGLTENDTFRSNQIREGMLTREKALGLSIKENEPRFESIYWYCETIGLDFKKTIDTVNSIPKLYQKRA